MKKRFSARDYTDEQISEEDLKGIVDIARLTPSWANTQPWNVHIACGETLEKIRETWIEKNNDEIRGNSDLPVGHSEDFGERGLNNIMTNANAITEFIGGPEDLSRLPHLLFNAPAIAYLTVPKTAPMWSVYDLGTFSMSLMLAATEKGINSVPAYELVKYPDVLRENMDIDDDESIIVGIALGYASENIINKYRSPRLEVEDILKIYND
ncbi:nitroreductase family protein [Methanobrevibacter sp.]|uniref:nitroreductase family protein n=1 Tax=Methanobrevibacter sp. TaxID=66852 RepID=UPI00388CFCE0